MDKRRLTILAAFVAIAGSMPSVGGAQSPSAAAGGQAVAWSGNLFEYTPNGFSLTGNAELIQGNNRLRADRINFVTRNGDLTQAEASGDVYFVTPDQSMRGDRATYVLAEDEVTVAGDVILTQGKNVATGERLVYNIRTENARMGGTAGTGGRVQGVFYPESGN